MTELRTLEQELMRHAKALRTLARDLVGETHADDLVQETALRALRTPPRHPGGLGAWLATILRRLAHNHRRDQERRRRREASRASDGMGPAADTELLRRESLRAVTATLFALPEPYQTVLVLRYFEDLTPTVIAQRTATPLPTVKSRLQRGLQLLRDGLDRRDPRQRWRPALLLATGTATLLPASVLTSGTILMAKIGKLLAAAAVLCGGTALFWQFGPGAAPSPAPHSDATDRQHVASVDDGSTSIEIQRREATSLGASQLADLDHPFAFELQCQVVDRDGLPVQDARIVFAPVGCALNTWHEPSARDGTATLRWRAKQGAMTVTLGVIGDSTVSNLHLREVLAGAPQRAVLLAEAAPSRVRAYARIRTRQDARSGVQVLDVATATSEPLCPGSGSADCRKCHQESPTLRGLLHEELRTRDALHPFATFGDLLLPRETPLPDTALVLGALRVTEIRLDGSAFLAKLDGGERTFEDFGAISGIVFGEDGRPAAHATVVACDPAGLPVVRTLSGKDGAFRLEKVPSGPVQVRAGGRDAGLGFTALEVGPGGTSTANVHLRREATIRGRALGKGQVPLVDAVVEYEASGSMPWRDAAVVQKDGSFVLPNLPGPGRLMLWPKGGKLPIAIVPAALPDAGEVMFDLGQTAEPDAELLVRVQLPDGVRQSSCELRVWQLDTGRGAPMRLRKDGAFLLGGLMPGFYRVELGGDAVGWTDLGQHWVDRRAVADLGVVRLQPPAALRVENLPAETPFELYHRRDLGDVRTETPLGTRREVQLPAGRWLALWRDAGGSLAAHEFLLRSGEVATLDFAALDR